ncbi:MAG: phosphoadenylyl-sulfate reductase [Alphaproteobacteria bacterium]
MTLPSPHAVEPSAPNAAKPRAQVRIVIVGHVDHGKSTLIGRLLYETGSLPEGKLEMLKAVSARRDVAFEWSFLLDALQTERNQGITIDTSQIRFRTKDRDVLLIDAPGHAEFLRNMITGAAQADAAILIVDAVEGVRNQTRRHGYLLHLLGVRQVAVVINKIDRILYDTARFQSVRAEIKDYLTGLGLTVSAVIPISARDGDGVAQRTKNIDWYDGPMVLEAIDDLEPPPAVADLPLRLPVQAVYRIGDERIVAGRIESGRVRVGDDIVVMPGAKQARIKTIESWPALVGAPPPREAGAGQSIGITLDRELYVDRGHLISATSSPVSSLESLRARVFWLHQAALEVGTRLIVRIGTAETRGVIKAIESSIDPGEVAATPGLSIPQNHVGEVEISLAQPLATDPHSANVAMGRVVLEYGGRIAGGGLVLSVQAELVPHIPRDLVAMAEDAARLNLQLHGLTAADRIERFRAEVEGRIVFTTSFGIEDQLIAHLLWTSGAEVEIVAIDTGRLFPEVYALWAETERRHGKRIRALYPRHDSLTQLVESQGIDGFYDSRGARLACCHVRKVEPLSRALDGARGWITGLRADQSDHRQAMDLVAADTKRRLLKLNPLLDLTRAEVESIVRKATIPINPLHAQGFLSIGCAPCTRAVAPDEPERAGRWWWENEDKKECGLHMEQSPRASV